jgi:hypothetical protein
MMSAQRGGGERERVAGRRSLRATVAPNGTRGRRLPKHSQVRRRDGTVQTWALGSLQRLRALDEGLSR